MTPEIRKFIWDIHIKYEIPLSEITEVIVKALLLIIKEEKQYNNIDSPFRVKQNRVKKAKPDICDRRYTDRRSVNTLKVLTGSKKLSK